MRNLIREILWAVIRVIRDEIAFRRFLRQLKECPPTQTKWRDAVAKITLDEWKAKVKALGHGFPETPLDTLKQANAWDKKLADDQRRGTMREINLHRSRKRPRSKFKKRWPHGKHSG